MFSLFRITLPLLLLLFRTTLLTASSNDAPPPIKIGTSLSLTGLDQPNGIGIKQGIETYAAKINANGGIQGRKLEVIFLDDGYDPVRSASNVRNLVQTKKVLALLGDLGTRTLLVSLPIINKSETLLFAPRTGADILYLTPPDRYIFNFRATYKEEITTMIKGLLSIGIKPGEIAFFTQNDSYGDAIYNSAMEVLKEAGYSDPESLPYGRYNIDQFSVLPGFATLVEEAEVPPKAIILGGLSLPNAEFINMAKPKFPDAIFLTPTAGIVSPRDLKVKDATIIVTQTLPTPLESDLPGIREYREDLKKYAPGVTESFVSLESYLATKLFVIGLQQAVAENKLSREGIIGVFENLRNIDLGIGILVSFSKDNHQAIKQAWPTILKGNDYLPLDWSTLQSAP